MIRFAPVAVALLLTVAPARGQEAAPSGSAGGPQPLIETVAPAVATPPAVAEPSPPAAAEPVSPAAPPTGVPPTMLPPPESAGPAAPPAPAPALPAPPAPAEPALMAPASAVAALLPAWASALLLVIGAAMAGFVGLLVSVARDQRERAQRRHAVAAALALELGARLHAFDRVPVPPNAEAGVSFVSLVAALAGLDFAFRGGQDALHLLPGRLAPQVVQHYAAVHRIATFVKGQSLAAAVRMLQANRIGGHPTPDAGAMRDAHVELADAFQGTDRLIDALGRVR
jgi:hypothetical protein